MEFKSLNRCGKYFQDLQEFLNTTFTRFSNFYFYNHLIKVSFPCNFGGKSDFHKVWYPVTYRRYFLGGRELMKILTKILKIPNSQIHAYTY
jgi:hypothetical protein